MHYKVSVKNLGFQSCSTWVQILILLLPCYEILGQLAKLHCVSSLL